MYEDKNPIVSLVHLYFDGAFNRRELIRRVSGHTGSIAAAAAVVAGMGVLDAQPPACPDGIKVPDDAPDLVMQDVQFPGEAGPLFGYVAYSKTDEPVQLPGLLVIHENRGLVEHIRDVTRRAARAGYVAVSVDLLSRQGGVQQFPEAQQQTQAYGRTTQDTRRADLKSTLAYMKTLPNVMGDRLGTFGFCAGGGNAFDLAVSSEDVSASVIFYGAPPAADLLDNLKGPLLGIYAELDRNLTGQVPAVITGLLNRRKTFGIHIYEGANHGFHNDTGGAYNPTAACDAWSKTIAWFDKNLKARKADA
ncbi:MAG TPA: dienelactone hydrolase family protein [Bryobacteraceae bacterium]|jgi:carboxymethylenebutenolidase|nr:dienelactone hydrolase family protein [Bryobacteraceae bacterium]